MKPSVFDAHIDTLMHIPDPESFLSGNSRTHVDQPRAEEAGVTQLVTAVCAEAAKEPASAFNRGVSIYRDIAGRSRIELLLMLEGCQPLTEIPDRAEIIDLLSFASLTWNGENNLGGGIGTDTGLTAEGREMAFELHEAGVILDVSHLSDNSRRDLFSLGIRTVATHCNCRSITDVPRNLPDEDIREIADSGGVIGINLVPSFLGTKASIENVAEHLEHAVEITNIASVGFGSDFDGTLLLPDRVKDCSFWPEMFELLDRRGWKQESIEAVAGDNWRRIVQGSGKLKRGTECDSFQFVC